MALRYLQGKQSKFYPERLSIHLHIMQLFPFPPAKELDVWLIIVLHSLVIIRPLSHNYYRSCDWNKLVVKY